MSPIVNIQPYQPCPTVHSISSPITISNLSHKKITKDILCSPSSNFNTSDLSRTMYQVSQSECFMSHLKPTDGSGTGTTSSQNSSSSHPSNQSDGSMSKVQASSHNMYNQKSELYSVNTNEFQENSCQDGRSFIPTATSAGTGARETSEGRFYANDFVIDSGGESDISSDDTDNEERFNGDVDTSDEEDSKTNSRPRAPYCKGNFRDRSSDYEDVWTPTPDKDSKDTNFNSEEIKNTATRMNNNVELARAQEEFRNNLNALTRALSLSTGSLNIYNNETKSPRIVNNTGHVGFLNPGFGNLRKQMSVESLNVRDNTKTVSQKGIMNPGYMDTSLDRSTMNSNTSTEEKITRVNYTFELPDVSQVTKRPDKLDIIPVFDTKDISYTSTLTREVGGRQERVPGVHVSEVKLQLNQPVSSPVQPQKPHPPPLNLTAANQPVQDVEARLRKHSSPPYVEPVDAITPDMRVPVSPSKGPPSPNRRSAKMSGPPSPKTPGRSNKALSMHDERGQLLQEYRSKGQSEVKSAESKKEGKASTPSESKPALPPRVGWVRRRKSAPTFPLKKLVSGKGKKGDEGKQAITVSPPLSRPPIGQKLDRRSNSIDHGVLSSGARGHMTKNGSLEFINSSNQHVRLHRTGDVSVVQNGGRQRLSSPPSLGVRSEKPRPFPVAKEEVAMTKAASHSGLPTTPPVVSGSSESSKVKLERLESIKDVPENGEETSSSETPKKEKPRRRILGRPLSLKVEKPSAPNGKKEKRSFSLKKPKTAPVVLEQLTPPLGEIVKDRSPWGSRRSLIKGGKSLESLEEGSRSSLGRPCSLFGCQSSVNEECSQSDVSSFKSFSMTNLSSKDVETQNTVSKNVGKNVRDCVDDDDSTLSIISNRTSFSETSTVEDLIRACSPGLAIKPVCPLTMENLQRLSAYDNLHCIDELQSPGESVGTVFCKPWDSTVWENLLTDDVDRNLPSEVTQAVQEWIKKSGSMSDVAFSPAFSRKTGAGSVADSWTYQAAEISEPPTPQVNNPPSLPADPASPIRSSVHEPSPVAGSQQALNTPSRSAATPNQECHTPAVVKQVRNSCGIDIVYPNVHEDVDGVSNSWVNLSFDERRPSFAVEAEEDTCLNSQSPQQQGPPDDKSDVSESFRNRIMPFLGGWRNHSLRNREKDPGLRIRDAISRLALDQTTTFGCTIENFIQCTIESAEMNPNVVTRNVRQFMSGIKNYLTKHGEGQLQDIIEKERNKLHEDEFLNIDAIVEGALHKCVIKPLKQHIYALFVRLHTKNGNLELLSTSIKLARTKSPVEIGVRPGLIPPKGTTLEEIKHYLEKMQKAYSPLKKLENLLGATSTIYKAVEEQGVDNKSRGPVTMGADDFLPVFIYVIVQCGLISAEIEADYMWGLLHPSLLAGEGGYYLTTLSSAVHVLKNFKEEEVGMDSLRKVSRCSSLGDFNAQGVMKILIPDEKNDTIRAQPLPVRPNMSTKDVCTLIAHKFRVTNPQDYGLYMLVDKAEIKLQDNECPQGVKSDYTGVGMECRFAYKRTDAAFAWPLMSASFSPAAFGPDGASFNAKFSSLNRS